MSDLDKYSVTGLDGVPRIDPIFTIPLPEPVISGRATFINEEPGKATDANPRPWTSLIVDQTKINPNPEIKIESKFLLISDFAKVLTILLVSILNIL